MEAFSDSSDAGAVSASGVADGSAQPAPRAHARKTTAVEDLLQRPCKCQAADCFRQFAGSVDAVQACRNKLRDLDPVLRDIHIELILNIDAHEILPLDATVPHQAFMDSDIDSAGGSSRDGDDNAFEDSDSEHLVHKPVVRNFDLLDQCTCGPMELLWVVHPVAVIGTPEQSTMFQRQRDSPNEYGSGESCGALGTHPD